MCPPRKEHPIRPEFTERRHKNKFVQRDERSRLHVPNFLNAFCLNEGVGNGYKVIFHLYLRLGRATFEERVPQLLDIHNNVYRKYTRWPIFVECTCEISSHKQLAMTDKNVFLRAYLIFPPYIESVKQMAGVE